MPPSSATVTAGAVAQQGRPRPRPCATAKPHSPNRRLSDAPTLPGSSSPTGRKQASRHGRLKRPPLETKQSANTNTAVGPAPRKSPPITYENRSSLLNPLPPTPPADLPIGRASGAILAQSSTRSPGRPASGTLAAVKGCNPHAIEGNPAEFRESGNNVRS